jgi:hypothetical protein
MYSTGATKRHRVGLPVVVFSLALCVVMWGYAAVGAQEPIGAADEIWLTSAVGETLYVGQEVIIQVHISNSQELGSAGLMFKIESPDGAWELTPQAESLWYFSSGGNFLSPYNDSRFWGDALESRTGAVVQGEPGQEWFDVGLFSFSLPDAAPGPLEHAFDIHLKPTSPGTIVIDSSMFAPPDLYPLLFGNSSGWHIVPAWSGPFEFTVVAPLAGDINCDGSANLADAIFIINWIFREGPPPCR